MFINMCPCVAASQHLAPSQTVTSGASALRTSIWTKSRDVKLPPVWTRSSAGPVLSQESSCPDNTAEVSRFDDKRSHSSS